jgi:hypothetical protein
MAHDRFVVFKNQLTEFHLSSSLARSIASVLVLFFVCALPLNRLRQQGLRQSVTQRFAGDIVFQRLTTASYTVTYLATAR